MPRPAPPRPARCTHAAAHLQSLSGAGVLARSAAELAATKKEDKYFGLAAEYIFRPIAVETLGPINESASDFFSLLAKKISHHSGDERETAFCSSAFPC